MTAVADRPRGGRPPRASASPAHRCGCRGPRPGRRRRPSRPREERLRPARGRSVRAVHGPRRAPRSTPTTCRSSSTRSPARESTDRAPSR